MKIYEPIAEEGIIDEINRLCNTTNESYKNRQKIARINEGLDYYFFLAAQTAPQGIFDDSGKSTAPIETQNIVAGTNAYKITDFTNNVLQILRVTVLNEDGIEEDLKYVDFEDVNEFLETYSTDSGDRGKPQCWTKIGDYIYIGPTPDYAEASGLRCYVNRELSKFSYVTFTTTHATEKINATAHGLSDNDAVLLVTSGTIPAGWTAEKTIYYVVSKAADTFEVSLTIGGSAAAITDDGSGDHKFIKVSGEPGIPLIHHPFLARFAAVKFMKQDHPNFAKTMTDLAQDKMDIQDYWQTVIRPGKTIIETKRRLYK